MSDCIAVESTRNMRDCFTHLHSEAALLGFEFSAFGMCIPVPVIRPTKRFHSNFPDAWRRHYEMSRYIDIDPTLTYGLHYSELGLWSDRFFANSKQLWQEAQSHGLRHGVVLPRHGPGGAYTLLVLARSHDPITRSELENKESSLQLLSHWAYNHIRPSEEFEYPLASSQALSEREIEVLRWTADGKTAADIAGFLGISERSVNFSIQAASCKLNASNKTCATVRAALLGLLW